MVLTNMRGALSPALFARLRERFSEAQILELGVVMAIIGGMAKLSFVVDVVEKEDYCPLAPVG
jgi:alkylhydroperoxidase family enzyme